MTYEKMVAEVTKKIGYGLGAQLGLGHNVTVYSLLNCYDKVIKISSGGDVSSAVHDYQVAKLMSEQYPDYFLQVFDKHDFFVGGERCFMYICEKGNPLMNTEQYSRGSLFHLTANILECLEKLHESNVIHCDIKPENILWSPRLNRFTLIDFDVSVETNQYQNSTVGGTVKKNIFSGTLYYTPYESLTGKYSKRSDIYAIAMTVRKLITEENEVFSDNDSLELIKEKKRQQSPIQDDGTYFIKLINKATQLNREKRYSSVTEMREALYQAAYKDNMLHIFEVASRIDDDQIFHALVSFENGKYKEARCMLSQCGSDGTLSEYLCYLLDNRQLVHLLIAAKNGYPPAMFDLWKQTNDKKLLIQAAKRYTVAYRYLTKLLRQEKVSIEVYQTIDVNDLTSDWWELRGK